MGRRIVLFIFLTLILFMGTCSNLGQFYRPSKVQLGSLNLMKVEDGQYKGEYDMGLVAATTLVEVKNGRIVEVCILEHRTGKGKKTESITRDVIARQSVQVDAVSGATISSKCILKSIEKPYEP